ncbi:hypothetical protein [Paracoccus pantotrophus]|uniref:hypothetical protein n=1 Tax=Paracoccus pantotrophus TaxID=82367 RepID=UPI0004B6A043|nr:hypothetical protein [Paracoccus pantotrophus]
MFKKKPGDSRNEALAVDPRLHAQVEREIAAARRRLKAPPLSPSLSDREAYVAALRRRADLVAAGATSEEPAHEGDGLADSCPQDGWRPLGMPLVDRHAANLLRLGPERSRPPNLRRGDALRLYIAERLGGDDPDPRP